MPETEQAVAEADIFLDLALSDNDLVRAEFDALIAASWDSPCEPPPDIPTPSARAWGAPPQPWWPRLPHSLACRGPARRPVGRGRSPPRDRG
ncbi:hypothetical protein ACWGID_08915 [Kribbella sp. NPDC054772]